MDTFHSLCPGTVFMLLSPIEGLWESLTVRMFLGFPSGSVIKNLLAIQGTQEMWVWSLGQEDPLKEGMTTHSVFWPGESHGQRSLSGYRLPVTWQVTVHRVAKSQTRLKQLCMHTRTQERCRECFTEVLSKSCIQGSTGSMFMIQTLLEMHFPQGWKESYLSSFALSFGC